MPALSHHLSICPTVVAGDVLLSSQAKYTIPKASKIIGVGETKMRELIQQGLFSFLEPSPSVW